MLLNSDRTRPPSGSSHEIRELVSLVGKTRRNASVDLICALLMQAIRVIDTRRASPKGHYVNPHKWIVRHTFKWEFDLPMPTNSAYYKGRQ